MNKCEGIPGRHCCSYAINDDPKRELCDVCLREKRIAELEAALRDLVHQIEIGEYVEQEGHNLKMNAKYLAARAVLEKVK